MSALHRLFRRHLYSSKTVLECMKPGKWYFGSELCKEHDLALGSIHAKLGELIHAGAVECRVGQRLHMAGPNGRTVTLARCQYRRT
jgi:hypothetical protein